MDSDPQTSLIWGAAVIHVVNDCVPIMPIYFSVPVGERCCVPPIRPSLFDACVKYPAFQLPMPPHSIANKRQVWLCKCEITQN